MGAFGVLHQGGLRLERHSAGLALELLGGRCGLRRTHVRLLMLHQLCFIAEFRPAGVALVFLAETEDQIVCSAGMGARYMDVRLERQSGRFLEDNAQTLNTKGESCRYLRIDKN